jgi:hypothetical protein
MIFGDPPRETLLSRVNGPVRITLTRYEAPHGHCTVLHNPWSAHTSVALFVGRWYLSVTREKRLFLPSSIP